ncbi:hypothetical protein KJ972_04890 [Candidatus Micrarchaeota archaeon]|nr:hypothetical protein [Candidatus Micrarchaeota archaeon]
MFCQTISVSNPKEWKQRDEKRPFKDNKEIISIRLAKILVNLVGLKEKQTLLDPFCGYATVLQEALLTGLNILGIEKDTHKSQVAQKNLEWIQKQFSTKGTIKIYNKDASQLASFLSPNSFHGVATEPYLGPYLKKRPTPYQAKTTIQELEPLYQTLFSKLAQLMKSNQKIVFIFPVFEWDRQKSITISPAVFAPWFYNTNPLQKKGPQFAKAFPAAYQNPKNKLKRTIWILTRK